MSKISLYEIANPYVFDNYLTIDGRYSIFEDQLVDLHNGKNLGNIFSFKNLETIFETIKTDAPIIKECKKILYEKRTLKESNFINEIKNYALINKTVILEQDVQADVTQPKEQGLIMKGVLYIARKLKSLMWSLGGMAVDAFLVASGIGKSVQWIPWAILLALDVYQWTSNDYGSDTEFRDATPTWKMLNIVFDVMGLMTTGPFAKAVRKIFAPIKNLKNNAQITKWLAKTPRASEYLKKFLGYITSAASRVSEASKTLSKTKIGNWFSPLVGKVGSTLKWVGGKIKTIVSLPGKVAEKIGAEVGEKTSKAIGRKGMKATGITRSGAGKGAKSATNTALGVTAFDKGAEQYTKYKTGYSSNQIKSLEAYKEYIKKYGDPFK